MFVMRSGWGASGANMMKQLLAPNKVRMIYNGTDKAAANAAKDEPNPNIPPPQFLTSVRVIWLTNIDIQSASMKADMRDHMDAIIDRGMTAPRINDEPEWLLNYVVSLVVDGHMRLGRGNDGLGRDLSLAATNEVLAYFWKNAWRLKPISVRKMNMIGTLRATSPDNWQALADLQLPAKPVSNLMLGEPPMIKAPEKKAA
jgi:hypothetical protein